MKTALTLLALTAAFLTGCATPVNRHETRVDRRHDHAENTAGRVEGRHDNRSDRSYSHAENTAVRVEGRHDNRGDRRGDRHDRVDTRYGY